VKDRYSQSELDELLAGVQPRVGWDFSRMSTLQAPAPWEYGEVVPRYLQPTDAVLDIGTGGGERFAAMASRFRRGLGIDIDTEMIALAAQTYSGRNLEFRVCSARLEGVATSFPVIINRHATLDLPAVTEHLRPGGYFITQQVGERNMACVRLSLGQPQPGAEISANGLTDAGLRVVGFMEYDVEYVVRDIESLVFWLSALDMPHADLDGSAALADVDVLNAILHSNVDERGFVTNTHRYLAVAQAPK
jgi:SAM-dependent methyltransferase